MPPSVRPGEELGDVGQAVVGGGVRRVLGRGASPTAGSTSGSPSQSTRNGASSSSACRKLRATLKSLRGRCQRPLPAAPRNGPMPTTRATSPATRPSWRQLKPLPSDVPLEGHGGQAGGHGHRGGGRGEQHLGRREGTRRPAGLADPEQRPSRPRPRPRPGRPRPPASPGRRRSGTTARTRKANPARPAPTGPVSKRRISGTVRVPAPLADRRRGPAQSMSGPKMSRLHGNVEDHGDGRADEAGDHDPTGGAGLAGEHDAQRPGQAAMTRTTTTSRGRNSAPRAVDHAEARPARPAAQPSSAERGQRLARSQAAEQEGGRGVGDQAPQRPVGQGVVGHRARRRRRPARSPGRRPSPSPAGGARRRSRRAG